MLNLVLALALANSPGTDPGTRPGTRPEANPAPGVAIRLSSPADKAGAQTLTLHGREYRVYVLDCDSPRDQALEAYLEEALKLRDTRSNMGASVPTLKSYLD